MRYSGPSMRAENGSTSMYHQKPEPSTVSRTASSRTIGTTIGEPSLFTHDSHDGERCAQMPRAKNGRNPMKMRPATMSPKPGTGCATESIAAATGSSRNAYHATYAAVDTASISHSRPRCSEERCHLFSRGNRI